MTILKSVAAGVLGFLLAWGGWHLYLDHQTLHVLVALENQRQGAAQQGGPHK